MSVDKEYLATHYSRLSDDTLVQVSKSELVPEAQQMLEAELARRAAEREVERTRVAELLLSNQERLSNGLLPLDREGQVILPDVAAARLAGHWCRISFWFVSLSGVVLTVVPPHAGVVLFAMVPWIASTRKLLRQLRRRGAYSFIALFVAVVVVLLVLYGIYADLGSARVTHVTLRGLSGLAYVWCLLIYLLLVGFAAAIGVTVALKKERFYDGEWVGSTARFDCGEGFAFGFWMPVVVGLGIAAMSLVTYSGQGANINTLPSTDAHRLDKEPNSVQRFELFMEERRYVVNRFYYAAEAARDLDPTDLAEARRIYEELLDFVETLPVEERINLQRRFAAAIARSVRGDEKKMDTLRKEFIAAALARTAEAAKLGPQAATRASKATDRAAHNLP